MKTPKTTSRRSFLKNTALAIPALLLASGLSARAADAVAVCGAGATDIKCENHASFDLLKCTKGNKVVSCGDGIGICSPGMTGVTCLPRD